MTITTTEIVVGEGLLGTQNIRRFAIRDLAQLAIVAPPDDPTGRRHVTLDFVWLDGTHTQIDGVGPIAARRVQSCLAALQRSG